MTAVKDINTLKVGDIVVWYNGPLTFKEKVVKMKDGRLAVRGIGSSLIPLTSLRLDLFKESNTNMENTESILEAARKALGAPLNENTIDIVKKVATLNIGDNTNFGRVLEIGTNSITFKAKDLPKTKITFNQRKIGSSDFVLSALTKLNEQQLESTSEETLKEKYAISAGYKDAVASLMKCERYFSPNSNLAKSIIAEFGEGYKKDFAEMEKYLGKVISLWEGIEMEIAMEE
jgi:hypothetical protein